MKKLLLLAFFLTASLCAAAFTHTANRQDALSSNNNLSQIFLYEGSLSPTFNKNVLNYTAITGYNVRSLSMQVIAEESTARIKVNGTLKTNPVTSVPINLGANTVTIEVTAENGDVKTYMLAVTRPANPYAELDAIDLSQGVVTPTGMPPGTTNYAATVPNSASSITVTPTLSGTSGGTTIKVNGTIVTSTTASAPITLAVGSNTITITVTAEDGTHTTTYTLTVTRQNPGPLGGLTLSTGTLSPSFNRNVFFYEADVASNFSSITLTPTAASAGTTILVKNVAVASGTASQPITLLSGQNIINIKATDASGYLQNYNVVVTRPASPYSWLADITLSEGTLSPDFNSGDLAFNSQVAGNVSSVTVTPTLRFLGGHITVNGSAVNSGSPSAAIPLAYGPNTITVIGYPEVGSVTTKYTLSVYRNQQDVLSSLTVSAGIISPAFSPSTTSYNFKVPESVSSLTVTPGLTAAALSVKVNGVTVTSGSPSAAIPLQIGSNTITVAVLGQNAFNSKTYTLFVTRTENAALKSLVLNRGTFTPSTLNPVFNSGTFNYSVTVPSNTPNLTVTATAEEAGAALKVNGVATANGAESAPIAVATGLNTIPVQVTASGVVKTYTLTVTRQKSAYLSKIVVSPSVTLTQVSGTASFNYTTSVSSATGSIRLNLIAEDAAAVIKIGSTTVASGVDSAPITLTGSSTAINVSVTSADGVTVKTYRVTVNKTGSNNAYLSKIVVSPSATLTQVSGLADFNYITSVPSATGSVKLNLTGQDAGAVIKIAGNTVASGVDSAPITLSSASTVVNIAVIAEDGVMVKTYKVTINKTGSSNAYLSKIVLNPSATITEVSGTADFNYTTSVPSATGSIRLKLTAQAAGAVIKIGGTTVASGVESAPITLSGASTVANITVTAEDGTTVKTYKVTINKTGSSNAYLSKILFTPGAGITQVTGPADLNYTAIVPAGTTSLKVKLIPQDAAATMKLNSGALASNTDSAPIAIPGSSVTVNIAVTAEDGVTVKTYAVTVSTAAGFIMAATPTRQNAISVVQKDSQAQEAQPEELTVKQAVSPNGDGVNDRFTIAGITAFPENTVRIMNRNGDVVYEAKGYDNEGTAFDGHSSKGTLQQAGTYFYSIAYKKGTETIRKTGYLVLKY